MKSDKDITNVIKYFLFQINAVFKLFYVEPWKKYGGFHKNVRHHNCFQHW